MFKKLGIKVKLILIFVSIKILPLVLVGWIAYQGTNGVGEQFVSDLKNIITSSKTTLKSLVEKTSDETIKDLDQKSKLDLERLSEHLAKEVAGFLYERDMDIQFLAGSRPSKELFQNFIASKRRDIRIDPPMIYDEDNHKWVSSQTYPKHDQVNIEDVIVGNKKEFHNNPRHKYPTKNIPIYKEVTFYDLDGKEKIKVSDFSNELTDVSKRLNTYIKAETYFEKAKKLKEGEIFVSEVIGAALKTHMIGAYTKARAEKSKRPFEPEKSGYGGRENPLGKRFEGIIRFVAPVFENGQKLGYVTLALDHQHVMNFTDYVLPKQGAFEAEISDAAIGNYAFMWDQHSRSISHPRDYFIVGFDPETGHRKPGWISADIAEKWKASGVSDLREFLQNYPKFEAQSLDKKPNVAQIKEGYISLDCRYLNFAPQCHGWDQLNGTGGGGSFVIFWSKVWKLTTVATIPYFTGQYNTQRGFGFITIGANVDEFHLAATKTKESIDGIVEEETTRLEQTIESSRNSILSNIQKVINEISISTAVLTLLAILVAIWISNYLTNRIRTLMKATNEISEGNLSYRIHTKSEDELGVLSNSVDEMAVTLERNARELKDYSENLEHKVESKTRDIKTILHSIKQGIFTFGEDFLVHDEYSQHLEEIFELPNLADENVLQLIFADSNLSADETSRVKSVIETTIDCQEYAFYCNAHLFPKDVVKKVNGKEKNLEIYWDPILDAEGNVEKIMAVVRDVTELKILEQENLAKEREMVMIGQVVEVGLDHFTLFHGNVTDYLVKSLQILNKGLTKEDKEGLIELERYIHTIKGNARTYNLNYLVDILHQLEQDVRDLKKSPESTDFSSITSMVEDCRGILQEYKAITEKFYVKESGSQTGHQVLEAISKELKSVDLANDSGRKVTAFNNIAIAYYQSQFVSLEELIMPNLKSLPRIAEAVNKPEPSYKIKDGGIRFSHKLAKLFDAVFVHLLRNSLDHGIEAPEQRTISGRESEGHISIEVSENTDRFINLYYSDDGRGLNILKLKSKMEIDDKNIANLDDQAIAESIFASGVSTTQNVTTISGRGVGMDAVKSFLQEYDCSIDIEFTGEKKDDGTRDFRFKITIPVVYVTKPQELHKLSA